MQAPGNSTIAPYDPSMVDYDSNSGKRKIFIYTQNKKKIQITTN